MSIISLLYFICLYFGQLGNSSFNCKNTTVPGSYLSFKSSVSGWVGFKQSVLEENIPDHDRGLKLDDLYGSFPTFSLWFILWLYAWTCL